MDDKLIDNLIQSDEIISKTIEEGVKSMETSVDDILSSVMSISVGDAQTIEAEAVKQATKEAQNIKASLSGTITTNLPTIPEIAKLEGTPQEGMVSEQTLGSLTSVMSNLEDVLDGMKTSQTTQIPQTPESSQIQTQQFDIDKISNLVNDFKIISSFDWASKWLSNVEKIADEVTVIKEELNNLPEESKLSLGVDETSLTKVEEGIQKVKENVTTDLSSLAPQMEEEQSGTLGESFLDGFSKFYESIFSVPQKSETQAFAPEEFLGSLSNFEEGEMKAVQSGISQILPEEIGTFAQPEFIESPFGIENIFGGLKSTFSSLFGGEEEEPESPLALTETTEVKKFETPTPPAEEEESGGISGFFSSIFGGGEKSPEVESESKVTQSETTSLPIGEAPKERKSLAELFQMAYGGAKPEPEEELEEDLIPKAEVEVKGAIGQPPALIENLEGLLPNEGIPSIGGISAPLSTPLIESKLPPIPPQMPPTVPFSLEALYGGILPTIGSNLTGVGAGSEITSINQQTITPNVIPPPTMAGMGLETPVESLFDFETTGAMPPMPPPMEAGVGAMPPMPPTMEAGVGAMPPMPPLMKAGVGAMPPMPPTMEVGVGATAPMPPLMEAGVGAMPPMPPLIEAGVGAMPPMSPQAVPTPMIPELGQAIVETPVESLFDFETTGAMPPMPPTMEVGVGATAPMPPLMEAGVGAMSPMPPLMEAGVGAMPPMPPQAVPMPMIPELGQAIVETPVESLFDFETTGAMPPMPPPMEAGVGVMPPISPISPQAVPMPMIPELGTKGIETPVESLFDFETTGTMPPAVPPMEVGAGAIPTTLTETLPSENAPVLEAIEPVETFEDIMRNILKNRASAQNTSTPTGAQGAGGRMMPPMPPTSQMNIESKESLAVPQTLSNISNESIPFGGELLPMPPTIKTEGTLAPPPELSFSSLEMFKDMDLFGKMGMGGGAGAPQNMPTPPSELMPFGSGMEDILIKSQSQKSPELSSAISKIQSSEMPATANMAVESQMMMGEVNLEPLSQKLSGSISSLGDAITSQATAQPPTPPEPTQFTVQAPVEQKAEPEQNTAGQGMGMSMSSESGISEAQARIIGRQIANEIKSSLAKLYS